MRLKQTTLIRLLALMAYFVIASGAQSLFSATAGRDADLVANLAEDGIIGSGSYGITALVYTLVPDALRPFPVYLLGSLFILFSTRNLQSNVHALTVAFLCLAPSMLTIATFQKDLLLVPFVVLAAFSIERLKRPRFAILSVVMIYLVYGMQFRSYYFLIAFIFIFIYLVIRRPLPFKIVLCLGLATVLLITPASVFQELQGSRDIVNLTRLNNPNAVGVRTAFLNLMPIEGTWSFIANYFYAAIKLNLAFLLNPGPRELFLQLNIIAYFFAIIWALRRGSQQARIASYLMMAHLLVLTLFEPDLGSYIRHLSCTLPYATIPLMEYFTSHKWRFIVRSRRTRKELTSRPAPSYRETPDRA
nr:hypothetical protein [Marinicella sp. W31]MDC2875965.1 hypothetical protein [Marinicella sp. W31]